jgi:hypothetical protein
MDAPADDDALLAEEALLLVVANAVAMRAVGAEDVPTPMQLVDADVAASTPGAAALLRSLNKCLTDAQTAGDAARGRARVARVCRRVRAASSSHENPAAVPHIVAHARARACASIYTDLARNKTALLGGAPALERLCVAAAPPALPAWCAAHYDGSSGGGSGAADVAVAWRMLVQDVAHAAPPPDARDDDAARTPEEEALAAQTLRMSAFVGMCLGHPLNSHDKQLSYMGATPEEVAAGKALCA